MGGQPWIRSSYYLNFLIQAVLNMFWQIYADLILLILNSYTWTAFMMILRPAKSLYIWIIFLPFLLYISILDFLKKSLVLVAFLHKLRDTSRFVLVLLIKMPQHPCCDLWEKQRKKYSDHEFLPLLIGLWNRTICTGFLALKHTRRCTGMRSSISN